MLLKCNGACCSINQIKKNTLHIYIHSIHTLHTYIHTYTHTTYIHTLPTYVHTYILHYIHTYIHTLHTHIHTYIHYIHTYIHTALYSRECSWSAQRGKSLEPRDDGQVKTYRSCQKHESVSLHDLPSTGRHLLGVPFTTNPTPNIRSALTTQNNTEHVSFHTHKTQLHFSLMYCNWNTSVTGHKQSTVGFSQRKSAAKVNCKLHSHWLYKHRLTSLL